MTRAKAGMGMKDQRMSSHGSLLLLHLERLKSSKPMERLSIGVQAASAGLIPTPRQLTLVMAREVLMKQMVVILQSTMFHLLLTHRYGPPKTRLLLPSVTDALYVLRTMVTRKFPVLFVLLTYVSAIFSVPFAKICGILQSRLQELFGP